MVTTPLDYSSAETDCETTTNSKLMMIKNSNELNVATYIGNTFWVGADTIAMTWLDSSAVDSTYVCASLSPTSAATNALFFSTTCLDISDASVNYNYVCQYNV